MDITTTFIYLRVAACSNAEILLSSSPGVTYGYKIILGMDAERSVLMVPGTEEIVNLKLGNPLQCATGWSENHTNPLQTGHIMRILPSMNSHRMHITFPVCKGY